MKAIIRNCIFYITALFLTSLLLSGVTIRGGVWSYVISGVVLSVMMFLLKPILSLISMPLNLLTFGLFSFVVNAIILFLLTVFLPQITINAFTIPHVSFLGFATPAVPLNRWFAILVASLVVSSVYSLLSWLTK